MPVILTDIQDLEAWRNKIDHIAIRPPQTILIEGGRENQRLAFGLYWAMSANCPKALELAQKGQPARPCLECHVCARIAANEDSDVFLYDGRISNTADKENPGPIRALNMENARELKTRIGAKPHGPGKRVVIFQGLLLNSRDSVMNSLLKKLEDPCGHTLFALLAPQRAQILPTLVSRSHIFTLPWPYSPREEDVGEWADSLAEFLATGNNFLDKISAKHSLDVAAADNLILACQDSLVKIIASENSTPDKLQTLMRPLAEKWQHASLLAHWLAEAREMLQGGVNPARVMEAFACKFYMLLRDQVR